MARVALASNMFPPVDDFGGPVGVIMSTDPSKLSFLGVGEQVVPCLAVGVVTNGDVVGGLLHDANSGAGFGVQNVHAPGTVL